MTDPHIEHGTPWERVLHEVRHVLCRAAAEAARHVRTDWSVDKAGPSGFDVRFTSTYPAVTVGFNVEPPEGDGPFDVTLSERGTPVALPVGMVDAAGGGLDRVLGRLKHADHWIALHLADVVRKAQDDHDERPRHR